MHNIKRLLLTVPHRGTEHCFLYQDAVCSSQYYKDKRAATFVAK